MSSIKYNKTYINDYFSIAGPLEKKGQIKKFNLTIKDFYYDVDTFEKAEIKMQRTVIENLLLKNHLAPTKIDYIVGGDLSNQLVITSHALKNYPIPFIGVYSACATFVESLILCANLLSTKGVKRCVAITSAHNLVAEKQFRYPVEYGAPKPLRSTFTATGSVGALVSSDASNILIESATIGSVVDMGIDDVFHMGAVMAPAAANTLITHLSEMKRDIDYYDLVLTGDLGEYGTEIFREYLLKIGKIKCKKHLDAGCELYKGSQNLNAGASGPATIALVLFNKIINQEKYKKILVIGTGSLHSPMSINQKNTIPSIAHAVSLEVIK